MGDGGASIGPVGDSTDPANADDVASGLVHAVTCSPEKMPEYGPYTAVHTVGSG